MLDIEFWKKLMQGNFNLHIASFTKKAKILIDNI